MSREGKSSSVLASLHSTDQRHSRNMFIVPENRRANSNMPLQQHPVPDYPYQVVGTDLFELDGQVYLLSVDFYSKWVCVEALQDTRSIDVIRVLEKQFVDVGCPQRLISDNGPQYGSFEFREFAKRLNIEHVTSSPSYARSNEQSERSVQTVKNSLIKMLSDGKIRRDSHCTAQYSCWEWLAITCCVATGQKPTFWATLSF